jgi:glycosyltransferase involved in cell wall biosynthesis
MIPVGVMHVIETLDVGGAERMAVNLANLTPRERYRTHLCTTKHGGPLEGLLAAHVGRLHLECEGGLDNLRALRGLRAYVREQHIDVLHAHGWSLFASRVAAVGPQRPKLIWHIHFGQWASDKMSGPSTPGGWPLDRPMLWLYRLASRRAAAVIAANEPLAAWSRKRLGVSAQRVWYIPNFISPAEPDSNPAELPGTAGGRIACVANFRAQKDHLTLIRAMARVARQVSHAHLLLVGRTGDSGYRDLLGQEIEKRGLSGHVSWLGERFDVLSILRACDIGVLSSSSEGLPLALIEYGMAGLATVATEVGQCAEVLDHGRAGILVPPGAPERLAASLLSLLDSHELRLKLGERFRLRVQQVYSPGAVVPQICKVYESVLTGNRVMT